MRTKTGGMFFVMTPKPQMKSVAYQDFVVTIEGVILCLAELWKD